MWSLRGAPSPHLKVCDHIVVRSVSFPGQACSVHHHIVSPTLQSKFAAALIFYLCAAMLRHIIDTLYRVMYFKRC